MAMSPHNIRIDDEPWARAVARAASEGANLSTLMRQWIEDYADSGAVGRQARVRITAAERRAVRARLDDIADIVVGTLNEGR